MSLFRSAALCALLAACATSRDDAARALPAQGLVDHHVHLLSPALVEDWRSLGASFSRPDEAYGAAAELLGPDGPVDGVVLVPMAHLYGNAELRAGVALEPADEAARVRAENEHVRREAEHYPGRAVPLASVDFTRPYARTEAERALAAGAVGLKLHLGSASPDLTDERVLDELAAWFAWAAREDFGVLLHLDPQRRGLEQADVGRFLEHVLGPVPDVRVVVAHLGGSGGFGAWTRSVLAALTDWLAAEGARGHDRAGVLVDVSAVLLAGPSEGVPATTDEEAALLGPALRGLGLERVVLGSDWPVFEPADTLRRLRERTDLTSTELARLTANRARW